MAFLRASARFGWEVVWSAAVCAGIYYILFWGVVILKLRIP